MDVIVSQIVSSFDFAFCIAVNILTYIIIKFVYDVANIKTTIWQKRYIMIICVILMSVVYGILGKDKTLIVNSAILAPVSWSWVFRPICDKLNINYKKFDD